MAVMHLRSGRGRGEVASRVRRRMHASSVVLGAVLALAAHGTALADGLLIRGAMVFDAVRAQPYLADVLVRDGKVARVERGQVAAEGVEVVQAQGLALLPGLFDVHTHWTPAMDPSSSALVSNAYLASGVTTLADFHQAPESWQPRREWLDGLVAPRVLFAARVSTPLGHGADWADQATTKWVNSPDAARRAIRELLPYQPGLIKVFTDGWRYGRMADNTSMDPWTLAALVDEAHAHDLRVATHTVTVERAKVAARAGVDVIAHSVLDRRVDRELVELMRASGTAYAPSLAVYEPVRVDEDPGKVDHNDPAMASRERNFANALYNVRALHRGGVSIVLGTDAGMPGTPHGRASLHELELLVRAGLSPAEALRAGTIQSARALGLDADSGSIEVGKRADLVLVEGEPWRDVRDMRRVRQVFVGGHPIHGDVRLPVVAPDVGGPNRQAWPLPEPLAGEWVDDFERADGRTALDTLRTGEADGGNDRTWQVIQPVPRAEGGGALLVTAALSSKDAPYANVVFPLSRGSVLPVDASRFTGIELEVRGNAAAMQLQLRGLERQQWTVSVVGTGPEWRRVRIELADASASNWRGEPLADAATWNGQALLQLVFVGRGRSGGQLWYELDNIRFY